MRSPVDEARRWIEDESPSSDEIQQSVDNLCYLYAQPPRGFTHEDVYQAITFLLARIGKNAEDLVLPEKVAAVELDAGELGAGGELLPAIGTVEDRRARFQRLKQELNAPPF